MKSMDVLKINENFIEVIGKEWMLIAAGDNQQMNMMTASWGGVGFLWGRPVAFVFVRPERYTNEFIERKKQFTLSFMGEALKEVHKVCGSQSGRNIDKVKETGLSVSYTELGNPIFEEARLTMECKVLYTTSIEEANFEDSSIYNRWYNETNGNPHQVYVAEILNAWTK